MAALPPPINRVPQGLVGSATRIQEVANPGLRHHQAVSEMKRQRSLREEVAKLSTKVQALEAKLAVQETASTAPELAELMANLRALSATASGDYDGPTSSGAVGAGVGSRPATAPNRTIADTASVVSWSADAYGKTKTPGWYHACRKELYKQRAARAAVEPSGCFVSHSKFADEAVRIAASDRPAFSSGKHPSSKPATPRP